MGNGEKKESMSQTLVSKHEDADEEEEARGKKDVGVDYEGRVEVH